MAVRRGSAIGDECCISEESPARYAIYILLDGLDTMGIGYMAL